MTLQAVQHARTDRTVDIIDCDTGDEAIISAYQDFNQNSRKQAILFSNDYGFIDSSIDTGVPAHHVKYPVDILRKSTGPWTQAAELLHYLAILFGVIQLPKVTVYGVWNWKDGRHWQHEQLDIDCRSPKIEPQLERDLTILNATD